MKTALVAGGAGFIGSHLCERLVHAGKSVICVDNLQTGSKENIQHLLDKHHDRFQLIVRDIRTDFSEDIFARFETIEEIYNLACVASPAQYKKDYVGTFLTCIDGTKNLAELALRLNADFLHASTADVYGYALEHPQKESYKGNVSCFGSPRACYEEGKRAAESLIYGYSKQMGLRAHIARIFNTYGPRMAAEDNRVVSNFVSAALKGAPLVIYGDGTQSRSFCYVDDMVDGLLAMLEQSCPMVMNLGYSSDITIAKLAVLVLKVTGSQSKIIHKDVLEDYPAKKKPDIALAEQHIGFRPKVSLEEGLKRMIDAI